MINISNKSVKFKLDTGAEANIMPKSLFSKLKDVKLRPTHTKLTTFSDTSIKPLGKTTVMCSEVKQNDNNQSLDFYVMDFQCTPLLGLSACQSLKLVQKVESIDNNITHESLCKDYNHLFQGLGKFEGKYHIETDKTVPPVVNAPRNVPYTIMPKLKTKLDDLVESGILVPVQEATDWVNSLVVTEKKEI